MKIHSRRFRKQCTAAVLVLCLLCQPLAVEVFALGSSGKPQPDIQQVCEAKKATPEDFLNSIDELSMPVDELKNLAWGFGAKGDSVSAEELKKGITDRAAFDWITGLILPAYHCMGPAAQDVGFLIGMVSGLNAPKDLESKLRIPAAVKGLFDNLAVKSFVNPKWKEILAAGSRFMDRLDVIKLSAGSGTGAWSHLVKAWDAYGAPGNTDDWKDLMQWHRNSPEALEKLGALGGATRMGGIALAALGLWISYQDVTGNEDISSGNLSSYGSVKSLVGAGTSLVSATLMLLAIGWSFPVTGAVIALVSVIWAIGTSFLDKVGEEVRKWEAGYRASYDFLMSVDSNFAAAAKGTQFSDVEQPTVARVFSATLAELLAKGDGSDPNFLMGEAMQKQIALVRYYYKQLFIPSSVKYNQWETIWKSKADFMTWGVTDGKPASGSEDAANQDPSEPIDMNSKLIDYSGAYKNAVNDPKARMGTLPSKEAYDQFGASAALYTNMSYLNAQGTKNWCAFNPDFFLIHRIRAVSATLATSSGDMSSLLSQAPENIQTLVLRVEQAPFNYLPLMHMDVNLIKAAAEEAIAADSYICLGKELLYFHPLLKEHVERSKETFGNSCDSLAKADRFCEIGIPALKGLIAAFKKDPNAKSTTIPGEQDFRKLHTSLGGTPIDKTGTTVKERVEIYKDTIQMALAYIPYRLAADMVDILSALGQLRVLEETKTIAEAHAKNCREQAEKLVKSVANAEIKGFLNTSTIGNNFGSLFSWASEIKSPIELCESKLKLLDQEVKNLGDLAQKGSSTYRGKLKEALAAREKSLKEFQAILKEWEGATDTGVDIKIPSDNTKIFISEDGLYQSLKSGLGN